MFDVQSGDHLLALKQPDQHHQPFHREAGNVFFALFGTIVFLGALGATVSTFIKGPLTSAVQVTRSGAAETQMAVIAQVITMQAASAGSCDGDPEVEPIAWRDPAGQPAPTGGGLVPLTLGVASTKDPWGSEFGYCVWNHGALTATCGAGRLAGATANTDTHPVIALVSAGPDKAFTTTCLSHADSVSLSRPMVAKTNSTDDDIIYTYSYSEAATASGGLWSLKSGDPDAATIDKNVEVGGSGVFSGGSTFSSLNVDSVSSRSTDFIAFADGFMVPNAAGFNYACSDTLSGVMRRSASGLEICLDDEWRAATGGGAGGGGEGAGDLEEGTADNCNSSRMGDVRYNPGTMAVEYCNASAWITMQARSPAAALSVSPLEATNISITGPCTTTNCPLAYGDPVHFVVTNLASTSTGALTVAAFSFDNGQVILDTTQVGSCQGATLTAGGTCIIRMLPVASGNGDFYGALVVLDGSDMRLTIPVHINGSGFNCAIGAASHGGIVASCQNNSTPDRVLSPAGCDATTLVEPVCSGDPAEDPQLRNSAGNTDFVGDTVSRIWGAQNIVNFLGYTGYLSPAQKYCEALVIQGYDDWYLPSIDEIIIFMVPQISALAVDPNGQYWSSSSSGPTTNVWQAPRLMGFNIPGNWPEPYGPNDLRDVRCMRRQGQPAAVVEADTSPEILSRRYLYEGEQTHILLPSYAVMASEEITSYEMVITSINVPVPISISGPGSPVLRINGEAPAASGTVKSRDIVTAVVTGPAAPGTENLYVITAGSKNYIWRVAYPAANTRRIFVTSTTYNGSLGGLAGADTHCQTRATAAGLTGTWYAFLSGPTVSLANRVPWSWNRLENMAGELVATDIRDLIDWSTESPIGFTETGARAGTVLPWTGAANDYNGKKYLTRHFGNLGEICNGWTSNAAGQTGETGNSSSTAEALFMHSRHNCNTNHNLYCMGPF